MIKEIQYAGYSTEPSDYECADGQLTTSLNLINEDNQLKPVFQPSERAELPDGYKIVFIHKTSTFTHYIIQHYDESVTPHVYKLYWIDEPSQGTSLVAADFIDTGDNRNLLRAFNDIIEVNAIGNTLIVLSSDGMHYFLWKNETVKYRYLGTHFPELPISFGLQGSLYRSEERNLNAGVPYYTGNAADSLNTLWIDSRGHETATNQILGEVNKFLEEDVYAEGKFVEPFFVRYAYRLYDESLTMHSAPVLMMCSTDAVPLMAVHQFTGSNGTINNAKYRLVAILHQLDYIVNNVIDKQNLSEWSDIIRSVDIYVSKPIRMYKQSGKVEKFERCFIDKDGNRLEDSICSCKLTNQNTTEFPTATFPLIYQRHHIGEAYIRAFPNKDNSNNYLVPGWKITLPQYDTDVVNQNIRDNGNFYLLKSINISDLATDARTVIPIAKDYLTSLETREVMTDDFRTHDKIIPRKSFIYNSRLNISNLTRELFNGFPSKAVLQYENGYKRLLTPSYYLPTGEAVVGGQKDTDSSDRGTWYSEIYVLIEEEGKSFVVKCEEERIGLWWRAKGDTPAMDLVPDVMFFYYPNPNAKKAYIYVSGSFITGFYRTFELPLQQHSMLNGSFYFNGWQAPNTVSSNPTLTTNNTIPIPNKIYASEVNNPFHFPSRGTKTVGTGEIRGICAAVKAMSQGQYGQFPLYVFTDEGVWALEIAKDGTFAEMPPPVTRDVCINPKSITQLDSSVLFATDRGIMLLSGSKAQCITDNIFTEQPFNVLDLPGIDQLHTKLGHAADACLPMQPFIGFLAGCQMIYDYVHQRIIVFNPTMEEINGVTKQKYTYAYVYSLKSQQWGMTFSNILSGINSYPDALAMTHDNKLVSFSDTDETLCKGLYITRPLKLEAANIHKTISALIQRGHFQRGDVGTVLYGSRDLYTWQLIWSSKDHYLRGFRGTPYKYFRIAGLANLTDGKSIFGVSINFEPRHTNQLR